MRRLLWVLVGILAVSGVAMAGIEDTKHDLGSYDGSNARICVFCHTPHNSASDDAPLWNHTDSAASYTLYDSNTLNASQSLAGGDSNVSALCMSCHDGTIALGSVQNPPRVGISDTDSQMPSTVDGYLGVDLTNDHPVSFTYDSGLQGEDGELNDPTALTFAQLFGASSDQLECASCHDVHDDTNQPFLLVANTGSQLCLDCHNK